MINFSPSCRKEEVREGEGGRKSNDPPPPNHNKHYEIRRFVQNVTKLRYHLCLAMLVDLKTYKFKSNGKFLGGGGYTEWSKSTLYIYYTSSLLRDNIAINLYDRCK